MLACSRFFFFALCPVFAGYAASVSRVSRYTYRQGGNVMPAGFIILVLAFVIVFVPYYLLLYGGVGIALGIAMGGEGDPDRR